MDGGNKDCSSDGEDDCESVSEAGGDWGGVVGLTITMMGFEVDSVKWERRGLV